PRLTHQGNGAEPDCFRTFWPPGSVSTLQRGEPPPVLPHSQPAGGDPTVSELKRADSARLVDGVPAINAAAANVAMEGFIIVVGSLCARSTQRQRRALRQF